MSKITKALNKAEQERSGRLHQDLNKGNKIFNFNKYKEGMMKNTWMIWFFIVGVVVTILVAFNYQSEKDMVPLSEIFSEETTYPVDIEYEFVETETKPATVEKAETQPTAVKETASAEVKKQMAEPAAVKEAAKPAAPAAVKQPVSQSAQASTKDVPFTIQVASFRDKAKAEEIATGLTKKGYLAYIASKDLGSQGTWHRVYVGRFDTKQQAAELLKEIQQEYANSFVISPKS